MSADPIEIRRIELSGEHSVWVPVEPAAVEPEPVAPVRTWRVRPAGVAVGALLAGVALLRLGLTAEGVLAAAVLAVLGVLSVIDIQSRLLPNRIIAPAAAGILALQGLLFPERLVECVVAALGAALLFSLPSLFRRGAMGMGDVKLAGLLGLALGGDVLGALMAGSLASVPVALLLIARGTSPRSATLPFGPFLAFGAAVALLA